MPNPNPSPATRFKPGQVSTQKPRSPEDRAIQALKRMSSEELAETCEMILKANRAELAAILDDPNTSMMQVNLISAIMADTQKGLTYTLDKLLERVVGKPKERIELSGDPDNPMTMQAVQVLISLPDNGRSDPQILEMEQRATAALPADILNEKEPK